MDFFKKYRNKILINTFLFAGYLSVFIDKISLSIYNSIYRIDDIANATTKLYKNIYNYINLIVAENPSDRWLNISYITSHQTSPVVFSYKEIYKNINLDTSNSLIKYRGLLAKPMDYINNELILSGCFEYEDITTNDGLSNDVSIDYLRFNPQKLFILKLNTVYICRVYLKNKNDYYINYQDLSSSVKIHMLMYQHPKMKRKLTLKISDGYYLNGNEILSNVFIARLIQEQYGIKNVEFDSRYSLLGFDGKMNIFKLGSEEYLKLGRSGFEILKIADVN